LANSLGWLIKANRDLEWKSAADTKNEFSDRMISGIRGISFFGHGA
jgi:methyl coenzyme M reductase gamma subunit